MLIERSLDITFFLVFEGFLIFSLFLFRSDRGDALSVFQVLYAFYHDFITGLQAVCNVKYLPSFRLNTCISVFFSVLSGCATNTNFCPVFLCGRLRNHDYILHRIGGITRFPVPPLRRMLCLLGKRARMFTAPVVWSITPLMVSTRPLSAYMVPSISCSCT